jgi:ATP-dependent Clp protease ATP-binding subunit ClpA
LRRVIQKEVEDPLALDLLAGRYTEGSTITLEVEGDRLTLV